MALKTEILVKAIKDYLSHGRGAQAELARRTELTPATIMRIANGITKHPDDKTWDKMCKVFPGIIAQPFGDKEIEEKQSSVFPLLGKEINLKIEEILMMLREDPESIEPVHNLVLGKKYINRGSIQIKELVGKKLQINPEFPSGSDEDAGK